MAGPSGLTSLFHSRHLERLAPLLPRMLDWMDVLGPHLGEISRDLPLLLPHRRPQ